MSTKSFCDGCGSALRLPTDEWSKDTKPLTIDGSRADGMMGSSPLPNGHFDWCIDCAKIAFQAVKDAQYEAWWSRSIESRRDEPRAVSFKEQESIRAARRLLFERNPDEEIPGF